MDRIFAVSLNCRMVVGIFPGILTWSLDVF